MKKMFAGEIELLLKEGLDDWQTPFYDGLYKGMRGAWDETSIEDLRELRDKMVVAAESVGRSRPAPVDGFVPSPSGLVDDSPDEA